MPADPHFAADLLGPALVVAVGLAATFVSLTVSSVDGISEAESGLASGLINTSQQIGGALGLAVLSAVTRLSTPEIRDTARTAVVTVTEGVVVLRADEDEFILQAGDVATIPARVSYRHWNGWDEETRVSETTREAGGMLVTVSTAS